MLGLDGLDRDLATTWAARGRLPVLGSLLGSSSTLIFGESNRPLPGSVWTDIATGCSAAVHGFQHEEQLRVGSYRIEPVNASRVAVAPFYQTLSDAGVRCAVVDFPIDHPIENFNGLQVVDWGTEFKLWHFETRPRALAAQLEAKYGRHPLTHYPGTRNDLAALAALKRQLTRGIGIKRRFAIDLIRQRQHEFIFVGFGELHKAGHFFWRFHDHEHPEFTSADPELTDSLRTLYEEMDRALGAVLAELDSQDDLIVVTDRGMYADHRGDHLIDPILSKLGWAMYRARSGPPAAPKLQAAAATQSLRSRVLSAPGVRRFCRRVAQRLLSDSMCELLLPYFRKAVGAAPPLDWSRTRVFRLPSVGNSYLRVNLAGREPAGIVQPGAEYAALLSDIAVHFRALVNAETGESAVEDVCFPASQFPGPRSAELPDVAILWSARRRINAVRSDSIGTIAGQPEIERSGNHRPEGFALCRGPSFAAGTGEYPVDARQLAPAILRRFGIPVPTYYERQAPWPGNPEGVERSAGSRNRVSAAGERSRR